MSLSHALHNKKRDHDHSGVLESTDFQVVGTLQMFVEWDSLCSGEKQWLQSQKDLSLNPVSSTCLLHDPGKVISPL